MIRSYFAVCKNIKILSSKVDYHLAGPKLICWSMGPTDPILSKNQKIILQNSGQLAFFKIYYFLLFDKKHRNKIKQTNINNQN